MYKFIQKCLKVQIFQNRKSLFDLQVYITPLCNIFRSQKTNRYMPGTLRNHKDTLLDEIQKSELTCPEKVIYAYFNSNRETSLAFWLSWYSPAYFGCEVRHTATKGMISKIPAVCFCIIKYALYSSYLFNILSQILYIWFLRLHFILFIFFKLHLQPVVTLFGELNVHRFYLKVIRLNYCMLYKGWYPLKNNTEIFIVSTLVSCYL